MMNIQVIRVVQVIIICLFMNDIRCQPFYYEDDNAYYSDSSANEMYGLDHVEHNEDGSMRALAGVIPNNDVATNNYYDDIQDSETELNDSLHNSNEETTTHYNNNYKDAEVLANKHHNNDLQYERQQSSELKVMKQGDTNPPSAEFVKERALLQTEFTSPNDNNLVRQFDQTSEKMLNKKHIKSSGTQLVYNNFNGYSPHAAHLRSNFSEDKLNRGLNSNGAFHRNISTSFGGPVKLNNDSTTDDVFNDNNSYCDPTTHFGCDVIHYERCEQETMQCRCLNGFFPENAVSSTGSCRAVSFYHGHIKVATAKVSQTLSSAQMMSMRERLLNLIEMSLQKQGLEVVLDLKIRSVEIKDQQTSLTIEVGLNKDILSGGDDVQTALRHDVMVTSQGEFYFDNISSEHATRRSNASFNALSALVELNPCINSDHNHCSQHASCSYTGGTVSCQCNQGYEDLTPNLYRLPGELCVEKCKCHNGGVCVDVDVLSGTRQCSCLKWHFGSECQIDGKELLLICCCTIGSFLILSLIVCCCYYGCVRRRDNMASSSMFSFSPDINILKLPRVWMDTTGYNDHELSPSNQRRMSLSSERSPYFDGYIMEDVSLGTLQRDRDNHSSYYQVSQTSLGHCPATMSSHSFYRY